MKSEALENGKAIGMLALCIVAGIFGGIFGAGAFVTVIDFLFGNGETAREFWTNLQGGTHGKSDYANLSLSVLHCCRLGWRWRRLGACPPLP